MAEESAYKTWVLALMAVLLIHCSDQLQPSQYEALWRIKNQLGFPAELNNWSDNADFCNTVPNPSLTLVCYEDNITQLHIAGNNQKLQDFSVSSFFSNLACFPNLKVLSVVSLGLWGPLPSSIGALSSLEIINVSSNWINGDIPKEISNLKSLQTLILDYNRFTGEVPDWVGSLPVLSVLSLKNNLLRGVLPNTLSAVNSLRTLVLSFNFLHGNVPNLQNLTNLQVLDLENNTFGPHLPELPNKLVSLVIKKNNFSSTDLDKLRSLYQLQKLDVSFNKFLGPFPQSLLSLSSLTYLDLSGNKLSGRLTKNMSCNELLTFVGLSTNRLTGELPSCLTPKYRNITVLYNGNCLSKRRYTGQEPESNCHNEAALAVRVVPDNPERKTHGKAVIVSSIVAGIIGGMVVFGMAFVVIKRVYAKKKEDKVPHTRLIVEKVPPVLTLKLLKDASYISETRKIGNLGLPSYRTFVLDELKEATDNFAASNLIGEGTHGQVYKGWLSDGTVAAIRCLKTKKKRAVQSYTRQLELVAKLRHRNLVSAIGHCFECSRDDSNVNKILLVLEYVPNGTLRSFISEDQAGRKFSWTQRLTAVIGIAKGIQFLHTGTVPIFSNDLKITDVLLDHDYHVKISKFNLPLLAETITEANIGASVSGTKHISAQRKKYEEKDDVYDFGVILLEVLVGRTINSQSDIDASRNIVLSSLNSDEASRRAVVDPGILKECSNASLKTVVDLCIKCLTEVPPDRPSVEDVIWNLQFAFQVQESWRRDGYSNQGSPAHLS